MENNFKVNMNEYLPLRDVVFNTLRQADFAWRIETGRAPDGDSAGTEAGRQPHAGAGSIPDSGAEGLIELRMNRGAIVKTIDEKYNHRPLRNAHPAGIGGRKARRPAGDAGRCRLHQKAGSSAKPYGQRFNGGIRRAEPCRPLRHLDSGRQRAALQIPVQSLERPQRGHCLPEAGPLYQVHSGAY